MESLITLAIISSVVFSADGVFDAKLLQELEQFTWKIVASHEACDSLHGNVYDNDCTSVRFIVDGQNYHDCSQGNKLWYDKLFYYERYYWRPYKMRYSKLRPINDTRDASMFMTTVNIKDLQGTLDIHSLCDRRSAFIFTYLTLNPYLLLMLGHHTKTYWRTTHILAKDYAFHNLNDVQNAITEMNSLNIRYNGNDQTGVRINEDFVDEPICPVSFCLEKSNNNYWKEEYNEEKVKEQFKNYYSKNDKEFNKKQHVKQKDNHKDGNSEGLNSEQNENQYAENDGEQNSEQYEYQDKEDDAKLGNNQKSEQNEDQDQKHNAELDKNQEPEQNKDQDTENNAEYDKEQGSEQNEDQNQEDNAEHSEEHSSEQNKNQYQEVNAENDEEQDSEQNGY